MFRRIEKDVRPDEGTEDARGFRLLILSLLVLLLVVNYTTDASASVSHSQKNNAARLWLDWKPVARCESGLQWRYNGRSGFDGALQFHPTTWTSVVRGTRYAVYTYAYQAPPIIQVLMAERWRKKIGGQPHSTAGWPHCGRYWRSYGTSSARRRYPQGDTTRV